MDEEVDKNVQFGDTALQLVGRALQLGDKPLQMVGKAHQLASMALLLPNMEQLAGKLLPLLGKWELFDSLMDHEDFS